MKNLWKSLLLYGIIFNSAAENLLDIYQEATTQDPTYQAAKANFEAVAMQPRIDLALLLPQATLSGKVLQQWGSTDDTANQAFTGSFDFAIDQELFNWQQWLTVQIDNINVKQAAANLENAAQQLILRTAQVYFDILTAHDTLQFATKQKEQVAKQLNQAQQRFDVGLSPITDVLDAKARYANGIATEIAAKNAYENSFEDLRILINRIPKKIDRLSVKKFKPVRPKPANINDWVTTAKEHNLNVIAANFAAQASKTNVDLQFAGHYPTASGEAKYAGSKSNKNVSSPFSASNSYQDNVSLDATGTVPIYLGGKIIASTQQARFNYKSAEDNLQQNLRETIATTKQLYRTIENDISLIASLEQAVISANESLKSSVAGFEVGTRTSVDVLTQVALLFNQKNFYARAQYSYIVDLLRLRNASGFLGSKDVKQINAWLTPKDSEALSYDDKTAGVI